MRSSFLVLFALFVFFVLLRTPASAAPSSLTYQFQEQIFTLGPKSFNGWQKVERHTFFRGVEVELPSGLLRSLPRSDIHEETRITWNAEAIKATIEKDVAAKINREAGSVRIFRDTDGKIAFEGLGLPGRALDVPLTVELTLKALAEGVSLIQLPIIETQPTVLIEDEELKSIGIRELVAAGESAFAGSPPNRRHNIGVGIQRFLGHLIPKGAEFSFNAVLGPVNAAAGYKKELTIKGERTEPDYGGGLCQVSTTAFRGVWNAGFPITMRMNHSFAVRYYSPEGTDATAYPPYKDVRFLNDGTSALLVQTAVIGDKAHFLYYGTKIPGRTAELVGPYTWDLRAPPQDRIGYTTDIPVGAKRIVSQRVPGMKTIWYRIVKREGTLEVIEPFYSAYETRPYFEEIGVLAGDPRLHAAATSEEEAVADLSGEDKWSETSASQNEESTETSSKLQGRPKWAEKPSSRRR